MNERANIGLVFSGHTVFTQIIRKHIPDLLAIVR